MDSSQCCVSKLKLSLTGVWKMLGPGFIACIALDLNLIEHATDMKEADLLCSVRELLLSEVVLI